jgi:pantoate--beta-alanine ligase
MSSRNRYLDPEQRAQAPRLYATLLRVADMLREDEESLEEIESRGLEMLRADGFDPDYLAIRERHSLSEPGEADSDLVVLAAARLGRVRLIDNLTVDRI